MSSGLWIPKHLRGGRKHIAIVFWHSERHNRILVGLPEEYPVPPLLVQLGFNKVVCRSAHDVEIWSQKLRDQERRDEELSDEQREAFEGPLRDALRKDLVSKMMNSRNAINRDFCRAALQRMDEDDKRRKLKRESFMHVEAAEDGK